MTSARRVGATTIATMFGVALTVGAAGLVAPNWSHAAGLDVWDLASAQDQLEGSVRENLSLDAEFEDTRARISLKQGLVEDLLARRASLKDVTAQFLEINKLYAPSFIAVRTIYAGATDEEKAARNVVAFAILRVNGSFAEKAQALARLANELRELTGDAEAEKH